ncbi:MAG: O-antigen ligase family protein [Chloroflexi bacterium]|nr:O-antigen ligase family protein [Chloroflexota bacterium]
MAVLAADPRARRTYARALLPPRGLTVGFYESLARRRLIVLSLVAILGALALGQALLRIGVAAVALPLGLVFVAAVIWKPRLGLFTAITLVLLFEMGSPDVLMEPGRYINYGLQSSLGISGFIASPLELLLILTFVVWLVKGLVNHTLDYRGGDLGWPVAAFFLAVLLGLLRGAGGGGDLYVAFWEARSLLYVGATYMLAANLIRTRRHVALLLGVFLVANGLFALEGAYRYLILIRTGLLDIPQEFLFAHEVVIFLGVLVLQAILQLVVGGTLWMRLLGIMLGPIGLFTLFATQRRAGYIALALAFLLMTLPWLVRHRKAVLLILLPSVVAGAIYLPVFWNNTGFLGQPARAVRSLYAPDERDASSNQYRDLEEINVRETIRSDPFLGVGFGREFLFVVPLPDLSWWPFWKFQPHHNILWVWLKVGGPGFAVFWMLMFGALAIAGSRALTLRDRTLVSFAYLAIASIVTTLIFCYVDLGLTNGRVTVFLGVVLGALSALKAIDIAEHGAYGPAPVAAQAPTEEPAPRPWSRAYQEAEAERVAARAAAREAAAAATTRRTSVEC